MLPADPTIVARALAEAWPDARCELLAADPWELLVAAILSARCTDERVNQAMAVLNEHVVGPAAYALLAPGELGESLRRLPLHEQKARAIVEAARQVCARHGGRVPADAVELAALPGVGRKVAAVVLGNAFGRPAVAADVHVTRIAHRLGWIPREEARLAEEAVAQRLPSDTWVVACHRLIRLGREHCRPKRPWCSRCPLADTCPRQGVADSR